MFLLCRGKPRNFKTRQISCWGARLSRPLTGRLGATQEREKHDDLLQAIAEGRLSIEEMVEALARVPGADYVIDKLVSAAEQRDCRRMRLRDTSPSAHVVKSALKAFGERYGSLPGVLGWHWGKAIGQGTLDEGLALVVCVREKLSRTKISPKELLPRDFEFIHEDESHRVPLDVQNYEHGEKQRRDVWSACGTASVSTGSGTRSGTRSGTLSVLLSRPDNPETVDVLFSGHVAQHVGAEASIADADNHVVHTGEVVEPYFDNTTLDGAKISGLPIVRVSTYPSTPWLPVSFIGPTPLIPRSGHCKLTLVSSLLQRSGIEWRCGYDRVRDSGESKPLVD